MLRAFRTGHMVAVVLFLVGAPTLATEAQRPPTPHLEPCDPIMGASSELLDYARRETEVLGIGVVSEKHGRASVEVLVEPSFGNEFLVRLYFAKGAQPVLEVVRSPVSLWTSRTEVKPRSRSRGIPERMGSAILKAVTAAIEGARYPDGEQWACLDGTRYSFRADSTWCGTIACPTEGSRPLLLVQIVHSLVAFVEAGQESDAIHFGQVDAALGKLSAAPESGTAR